MCKYLKIHHNSCYYYYYYYCLCAHMALAAMPLVIHNNLNAEFALAQRICRIAERSDRQLLIIYSGMMHYDEYAARIELKVHNCMSNMPHIHIVAMQQDFKTELIRKRSSLSIYILSAANLHHLHDFLLAKQREKHTHHYVFLLTVHNNLQRYIKELFQVLWTKRISKVIVLETQQHGIYTYEPFSPQGWRILQLAETADYSKYFYEKFYNFYGYQLRISMFTEFLRAIPLPNSAKAGYMATDGCLAKTIVEKLNATAIYVKPRDDENFGWVFSYNNVTGSLKDIMHGEADIRLNLGFTSDPALAFVEELYPLKWRVIYLIVPIAKLKSEYLIFIHAFDSVVWQCWLVVFLLLWLIFCLIQSVASKLIEVHKGKKVLSLMQILQLLFYTQICKPFKEHILSHYALRIYLLAYLIFSYIWQSIYFAKLESNFVHPVYDKNIDRLSDLWRLDVPIFVSQNLLDTVRGTLHANEWQHLHNLINALPQNYSHFEYYLTLIDKYDGNVAFILNDQKAIDLQIKSYDNHNNRRTYHIMSERLRSLPSTYVVPLGSPYMNRFDLLVMRCVEHGFIEYWNNMDIHKRSYTYAVRMNKELKKRGVNMHFDDIISNNGDGILNYGTYSTTSKKLVVLSFGKLQGAFYMYLLGIITSLIAFSFENYYYVRSRATTTTSNVNK